MSDRRARIRPVLAADLDEVRRLFRAYADWLKAEICLGDFEAELATLPGPYAAPAGGIWLAGDRRGAVGVVALRPLAEPGACEIKRLFVAPEGRGRGLGTGLLRACIEGARARGCKLLYLETLSARMPEAERLYRQAGFAEAEPFADDQRPEVRYLALALRGPTAARPGGSAARRR